MEYSSAAASAAAALRARARERCRFCRICNSGPARRVAKSSSSSVSSVALEWLDIRLDDVAASNATSWTEIPRAPGLCGLCGDTGVDAPGLLAGLLGEVLARGRPEADQVLDAEAPLVSSAGGRVVRAAALLPTERDGRGGYLDAEALTLLQVRRSARGGVRLRVGGRPCDQNTTSVQLPIRK